MHILLKLNIFLLTFLAEIESFQYPFSTYTIGKTHGNNAQNFFDYFDDNLGEIESGDSDTTENHRQTTSNSTQDSSKKTKPRNIPLDFMRLKYYL